MKLKIYHIYANDTNLGDLGSAEGIKMLLRKSFKEKLFFKDFYIALKDLSEKDIAEINSEYDLVIIGGGGLYWTGSKETLLKLSEKTIKKIRKPIIIYAVGINYEKFEKKSDRRLRKNILKLHDYVKLSSARDEETEHILREGGIKCHLAPCPSIFVNPADSSFCLKENNKKNIGIVLIPTVRLDSDAKQPYINSIAGFAKWLKNDYNVYLLSHCKIISDSYYLLSKKINFPLIYSASPKQLMSAYKQMDFLVGSRGHMGMYALGAEKPFLMISYNKKCDAFCKMLSYPDELIMPVNNLTAEKIICGFDKLKSMENVIKQLMKTKKNAFYILNLKFIKQIQDLL